MSPVEQELLTLSENLRALSYFSRIHVAKLSVCFCNDLSLCSFPFGVCVVCSFGLCVVCSFGLLVFVFSVLLVFVLSVLFFLVFVLSVLFLLVFVLSVLLVFVLSVLLVFVLSVLLVFVLSVLRFTASDYAFDIFKYFPLAEHLFINILSKTNKI